MGPPIYGFDLQGRSRLGPISRLYEKKVGLRNQIYSYQPEEQDINEAILFFFWVHLMSPLQSHDVFNIPPPQCVYNEAR